MTCETALCTHMAVWVFVAAAVAGDATTGLPDERTREAPQPRAADPDAGGGLRPRAYLLRETP